MKLRRQRAKWQYDKAAKQLPELVVGQTVRLQPTMPGALWEKFSHSMKGKINCRVLVDRGGVTVLSQGIKQQEGSC